MTIEKLKLPKGRIVGGHPVIAEKKINFKTKQPVIGKDGQHVMQWRVEYAIPKDQFLSQVWPLMVQEAATAYPINPQTGQPNVSRDFSWKMVDGDSPETPKGSKTPYNVREGYPGCYILTLKTEAFSPGVFVFKNGAYHAVQEHEVKCGDYLIANIDIRVHTENDGGLYLNPNGFELVEIGTAISTGGGGNPEALFGEAGARPANSGFQGQLPTQHAMPAAAPAPQQYAMPAAAPAPQQYAMPAAAPMAAPNMLPPPATGFVSQAGNAAPVAGLPAAPPSAQPAISSPGNPAIPGLPQAR